MAKLPSAVCLGIGRAIARTECGLAVSAQAIRKGDAAGLQTGLNTVRFSVRYVAEFLPEGPAAVRKILGTVGSMDRELRKGGKISKAKSKKMFESITGLKSDIDKVFAMTSARCPKGK